MLLDLLKCGYIVLVYINQSCLKGLDIMFKEAFLILGASLEKANKHIPDILCSANNS